MSKESKDLEKELTSAGAVQLDESELDDVAGGNFQASPPAEQVSTTQTADGKYVVNKLVGRPK